MEAKSWGKNIGTFIGLSESSREFIGSILVPYGKDLEEESHLLLGAFVVVAISEKKAILGRVINSQPTGDLTQSPGEDYLSRLHQMGQGIPQDLKKMKLRYNVGVRFLGTLEVKDEGNFHYSPGIRSVPHLGAQAYIPNLEVLEFVSNVRLREDEDERPTPIGHYALGDKVFPIHVRFGFERLVAKRTLVFAKAGYGKSNLVKLMVARLYEAYEGKTAPGMLIFDPEGEYAFRDNKGRPGLADLPRLRERLVVFTDRKPEPGYEGFIAGGNPPEPKGS